MGTEQIDQVLFICSRMRHKRPSIEDLSCNTHPLAWTDMPCLLLGAVTEEMPEAQSDIAILEFKDRLAKVWKRGLPGFALQLSEVTIKFEDKMDSAKGLRLKILGGFGSMLLVLPIIMKTVAWAWSAGHEKVFHTAGDYFGLNGSALNVSWV